MNLRLLYGKELILSKIPQTEPVSLRHVMMAVEASHPEIFKRWLDGNGNLRETLTIFVNRDHIRYRNGLETPIEEDDEIYIVPLITGA